MTYIHFIKIVQFAEVLRCNVFGRFVASDYLWQCKNARVSYCNQLLVRKSRPKLCPKI